MTLSHLLAAIAGYCGRNALRVISIGLLLGLLAAGLTWFRLGVSTDTDALFAANLPWRQRAVAFDRDFPQFRDLLVAVIDADSPEAAEATAAGLEAALKADPTHFAFVRRPDASPYLEANGLLFLEPAELQDLLDRTIDAQPFLGQLAADPSARGLFAALSLLAIGAEQGANLAPFAVPLGHFHTALAAAAAGKARPLSWQSLLGGGLADKAGPYRFVLAQAKLDLTALEPGAAAGDALRKAASSLEFVRDGSAHVRLTGGVALQDEEFSTVAQGAVAGAIGSAALVVLWLVLAVRSIRLIVPIIATLALGLLITTGFAALAIGTLNLISVAFAVLFVGIAVDLAIQYCVRARELRLTLPLDQVIPDTAAIVGPPVLVSALSAAAGFLAFAPTSFKGVAELGLIAGFGMVVALVATLTFLPAMLALCRPKGDRKAIGVAAGTWLELRLYANRPWVLGGFLLLGLLAALLAPRLAFDSDPLHTKDPTTEAMRTLADLAASPLTNPYSIDILMPSQAAADALVPKLEKLPLAAEVLTLSSFVPTEQPRKLEAIADAAGLLGASLAPRAPAAPVTPADLRLAAKATLAGIEHAAAKLKPADPLTALAADLRALSTADDKILMEANAALTRFLPLQLSRLRAGLAATQVAASAIPPDLARDWKLPDGRVRVQVTPNARAAGNDGLHEFVAQVRAVAPEAAGSAVQIVETAATIVGAFQQATFAAIAAIAILLAAVLRRFLDVLIVLLALALSALLTVLAILALGMSLNFANIIALPLLQGVGVSFNIYFVMNWRAGQARFLGTATARAILFSALTTATAFGSLALSHHPGTASMGELLLLSLATTMAVTLLFLPTLLRALMRE
jgi:hypothetical protein